MGEDETMRSTSSTWPTNPYRGLDQYGPDEAMLFAGRTRDAYACAHLLAATDTRILLLHGTTGSGKSSLLRAALIPILGSAESGFLFLLEGDERPSQALFVRSTDAPLSALAGAIYEFAAREFALQTPRGRRTIDLSPALLDYESSDAYRARVSVDHRLLLESLRQLGALLPRTLVLIVDQGEEVMTLTPGPEGNAARDEFFRFIAAFSRADLDLKLLVALRTEYYGRFRHEFQKRLAAVARIADYYLGDLEPEGLRMAIIQPTEREAFGDLGSPFDHYRFEFEPGLPEQIVTDLNAATPAGGVLPALQIVCSRLYQRAIRTSRQGSPARITAADYAAVGGIDGQINDYIESELEEACRELGVDGNQLLTERGAWKQVLSSLARPQIDGTVTTDMKRSADLAEIARSLNCKLPFDAMMTMLCSERHRLCRRVEIMRRVVSDANIGASSSPSEGGLGRVVCFTLAHEALGPPLLKLGRSLELLSAEIMVATGLLNRGILLSEEGRFVDAIAVCDEIVRSYGDRTELDLAQRVAYALLNKGFQLGKLGRLEDELAVYEDLLRRFSERSEVSLTEPVAKALFNKGARLGEMERREDELAVYEDLVSRYGERDEVPLAEPVARALFNKAIRLGRLDHREDEIATYDQIVRRYGERVELPLAEQVAKALVAKGIRLGEHGRVQDAMALYDEVVRRFGERTEVPLAASVANALFNKGVRLAALERSQDEIAAYDDLLRRFAGRSDVRLAEHVGRALVNKALRLGNLERRQDSIAVCDEVVRRYGERNELPRAEQVAKALALKGVQLGLLGHSDDGLAAYDEVMRRFGERTELPLAALVARILLAKGHRLRVLGRSQHELATYDEVVRRFGEGRHDAGPKGQPAG
jgi:tetratricopeptide (TPR) repeat protein